MANSIAMQNKTTYMHSTYMYAIVFALIIGFSFLLIKVALVYADPIDTLAYRFTVSFLAILVVIPVAGIRLDLPRKAWLSLLPLGVIYPVLFFGFQVFGLVYATSSEGGIIQAFTPILTLILASFFLKERSTRIQKLSVICSVAGIILIFVMKGASINRGDMYGIGLLLLSTFALAVYSVLTRSMTRKYNVFQMSFVMMLSGAAAFDALSVAKHALQGTLFQALEPLSHPSFVLSILYLGVLSSLVSSLLSNFLLSKLEAFQMNVFLNFATLISILAGVVFLHEQLTYYHIVGTAMIIAGVLGANYRSRKLDRSRVSREGERMLE